MRIGGLQKTSLIDFPGRLACTVFTVGCNFRCPYCHNKELLGAGYAPPPLILEKEFFDFLKKRKGILEGVCITGGEPCLQSDLKDFCKKIKRMGLEVKLDTNGSRPEVLEGLIERGLIDMVAMDVKGRFEDYPRIANSKLQISNYKQIPNYKLQTEIKKSVKIILESGIEYELRTTVVPGIHDRDSLIELAKELKEVGGENLVWVLQKFKAGPNCLDEKYRDMESFSDEEMEGFLRVVKKVLRKTELRV